MYYILYCYNEVSYRKIVCKKSVRKRKYIYSINLKKKKSCI